MFSVIFGMMMGAVQPGGEALCDVGRAAIADLPPARQISEYVETDPERSGVMRRCPQLATSLLPQGYRVADDDARARASQHVPVADWRRAPAGIYIIGVPVIAADGRSATVAISWECTGPCGSETVSRYVRTARGWRRDGEPKTLSVS